MDSLVLIETLWNVNEAALSHGLLRHPVLIETLWNVNLHIWRIMNQTRLY